MQSSDRSTAVQTDDPAATRLGPSADQGSDVVADPLARRSTCNDSDLRYLREALPALRDAHTASDVAAAGASDPRVRELARQARTTQADAIRSIKSILNDEGHDADGLARSSVMTPPRRSARAASDPRSLDGLDVDRRFMEILTAHAEASLSSAQTELIEGFSRPCRLLAEEASSADWRDLAAIGVLMAPDDHDRPSRRHRCP